MIVQLKKRYQCQETIEELDKLVDGATSLFDNFSSCRVSGGNNIRKLKRFETIILDHLIEKTNFENAFDSIKISYGDIKNNFHTVVYDILCKLGQKRLKRTFNNFLKVLDEKIKELKKKPIEKYTYYIPTRIESSLTEEEFKALKKTLKKATSVSIYNPSKKILKEIKSNNYKRYIQSRKIILKFEIKSRDYLYPIKILDSNIYSFVGALAFSNNLYWDKEKWMSSSSDMAIATNPIEEQIMIVKEGSKIVYPPKTRWQILDYEIKKEISLIGKEIWDINNKPNGNYKRLKAILNLMNKQENKIKIISEESLKLYLEAISEKQLEISFLKFWVITERVLKQGGKRNDISLLNVLKKIIKDKHLNRMIDGLYRKRNDLVHEFKVDYITQQDRNLAKAISEDVILFLIDPPTKIKNVQDLRTLIDNIFLSKSELKKKQSIISKILKKKK